MTGHKTAAIRGTHLSHQIFLRRLGELIALVIEDEKARTRSRRQFAELSRWRVIGAAHPLPLRRRLRVTRLRIDLMNQNVAAIAGSDDAFARAGIARNDDRPVGSLKTIAKCACTPFAVVDVEGRD